MLFLILVCVLHKILETTFKLKRKDTKTAKLIKTATIIGLNLLVMNSIYGYSPYNSIVILILIYILSVATTDSLQLIIPTFENYETISWKYSESKPKYNMNYKNQKDTFNRVPNNYRDKKKNIYNLNNLYPKTKELENEKYEINLTEVKKNLTKKFWSKEADNSVFDTIRSKVESTTECPETTDYEEMVTEPTEKKTGFCKLVDEIFKILNFYNIFSK